MMVVVMMMVMVVCSSHHLRLRRDRSGDAEDNDKSEEKPFHDRIDAEPPGRITKLCSQCIRVQTKQLYLGFWS
jgi:hypothetical protein